ncbi:MAG: hypothetical protein HY541_08400 [Deltaproteobacteria bacterium]|nr:hypothetical protein [Deltaproteobacteria bacterium]
MPNLKLKSLKPIEPMEGTADEDCSRRPSFLGNRFDRSERNKTPCDPLKSKGKGFPNAVSDVRRLEALRELEAVLKGRKGELKFPMLKKLPSTGYKLLAPSNVPGEKTCSNSKACEELSGFLNRRWSLILNERIMRLDKKAVVSEVAPKTIETPKSGSDWDGFIEFRVPANPDEAVDFWNSYTFDGHSLVDLVAHYAGGGISEADAALWLSASFQYYLQAPEIPADRKDSASFVALVENAMAEGRLEVDSGTLSQHPGDVVQFGYAEPGE